MSGEQADGHEGEKLTVVAEPETTEQLRGLVAGLLEELQGGLRGPAQGRTRETGAGIRRDPQPLGRGPAAAAQTSSTSHRPHLRHRHAPGREPPTSKLEAISLRRLRRQLPGLKLVVSYADREGHLSLIYQATNWLFLGEANQPYIRVKSGATGFI